MNIRCKYLIQKKFTKCELFNKNRIFVMRVHLIKKTTIENFAAFHANSRAALKHWQNKLKLSDWKAPEDILRYFDSADLLGRGTNRVVFDVGGNNYRIICRYAFGGIKVRLYICWIGTHNEYDKLCAERKQFFIQLY